MKFRFFKKFVSVFLCLSMLMCNIAPTLANENVVEGTSIVETVEEESSNIEEKNYDENFATPSELVLDEEELEIEDEIEIETSEYEEEPEVDVEEETSIEESMGELSEP